MKVFVAEDDPVIVEGLKIALSQEGYEVEAFEKYEWCHRGNKRGGAL